jgi:hypothetical protein
VTLGERIEARRKAIGVKSQSALARMVPMNQSTLNGLVRNPYRWSPYLPALARALQTTVEYLVGETDDPDENAPAPPQAPTMQMVMMPVALPNEAALKQMFAAMLSSAVDETGRQLEGDALAHDLAMLLPSALGNLRGPLIEMPPALTDTPPAQPGDADVAPPVRRRA